VESLKYFEIHGVQEKEPKSTYINPYQSNRHGYLPEAEEENIAAIKHCLIGSS
jgi:hypothetical protein